MISLPGKLPVFKNPNISKTHKKSVAAPLPLSMDMDVGLINTSYRGMSWASFYWMEKCEL